MQKTKTGVEISTPVSFIARLKFERGRIYVFLINEVGEGKMDKYSSKFCMMRNNCYIWSEIPDAIIVDVRLFVEPNFHNIIQQSTVKMCYARS